MLLLLANSLGLADAASLAFDAASLSVDADAASLAFDAWATHHRRAYATPAERALRRAAFEANLAALDAIQPFWLVRGRCLPCGAGWRGSMRKRS